jgi:glycosyltransferase involved in cell wall biosynthesis
MVEAWDGWLERLVFVRADLLIANTSKISELFKSRGTSIAQKTITIPNGFDPEDFADIEALRTYPDDKCLLVHAGVLYGPRNPINFLLAVQELARNNICPHLQILFVGPSMPIGGETLKKVIIGMGLSTYIQTNPSVPHARALSLMKGADALLLLALGTRLQVPAKLFEYFALRKPICSITESDSATVEMTARMGGAIYSAENTPREIRKVLEVLYSDWERGQFANRSNNFVHDDSMHRIVQTQALEGHFISLMKNRL